MGACILRRDVPTLDCPDCEESIAMHELETRTVAQSSGFRTSYRCPFCHADFEDIEAMM
jgi:transposase-like protein